MNHLSSFDPDDEKLTAYALGELPEGAERIHVEQLLAASPEVRAAVEEIRSVATLLAAEYYTERQTSTPGTPAGDDRTILFPQPATSVSRWWSRPALKLAAVLVVLAGLTSMLLPVSSKVLQHPKRALSIAGQVAPASEQHASRPPAQAVPTTPDALLAMNPKADVPPAPVLALQPSGSSTPGSPQEPMPGGTEQKGLSVDSAAPVAALSLSSTAKPLNPPLPAYAKRGPVSVDGVVGGNPGGARLARRDFASAVGAARPTSRLQPMDDLDAPRQAPAPAPASAVPPVGGMYFPERPEERITKDLEERNEDTATYDHVTENTFLTARDNPLSTFSIDVDTASYANVRRFIESNTLPPKNAVRVEELLNYFPYDDAPPAADNPHPFALHLEAAACPWNPEHRLVRIGIKGREMAHDKRPPSNLVFLIDVSGSMMPPERLPLIKEGFRLLVEKLSEDDHVAIVVYAGNTGLALPSTSGDQKSKILHVLDHLEAGGSTNGAGGIQLAYKVAQENFIKGGVNRVILATDGDFNVGITNQNDLVRLIEKEAKSGVFLSALGVGTDNYKDSTMQKLADRGNGNYAYLDRLEEARKVLVEQMSGTLVTIAKDVKIQVEFNPAQVASYRLIGYEKRLLRKEDFNDDKVDAGEIGAGHSVTALYEIVPVGRPGSDPAAGTDSLKYPSPAPTPVPAPAGPASPELLTLKMRYKAPDADKSERAYEQPLVDHPGETDDVAKASADFKFAAAVAEFGLVLHDSPYKGSSTLAGVIELAHDGRGPDASGYRTQFIDLVRRVQALEGSQTGR